MHRKALFVYASLCILNATVGLDVSAQGQASRLIHVGDPFPEIPLRTPEDPNERAYLGLPRGREFFLREIDAELILVEILSVYCSSCQRQAPMYNKLYERIEKDPATRGRIKMIGIAAGNGELEIQDFRENYGVPFPIFPDPQFEIHRAIGGSRTPFSIFVRQGTGDQAGLVGRTHLGIIEEHDRLLEDMRALSTLDLVAIRNRGEKTPATIVRVEPLMPQGELIAKLKAAMETAAGELVTFEKVSLDLPREVYMATVEREGRPQRLFAEMVGRPSVCDACHDVHFFYVFDTTGKVVQFVPLKLTKYGNEPWSEADLAQMRQRLLGRQISERFVFDHRVDGVSSATITSVLIFDSLSQGRDLFQALKDKGLIR